MSYLNFIAGFIGMVLPDFQIMYMSTSTGDLFGAMRERTSISPQSLITLIVGILLTLLATYVIFMISKSQLSHLRRQSQMEVIAQA